MIVPMKKVMLLALLENKEEALHTLRDLGVMQIQLNDQFSERTNADTDKLRRVRQQLVALNQVIQDEKLDISRTVGSVAEGEKVLQLSEEIFSQISNLKSEAVELQHRIEAISMWGDFDRQLLDELSQKGVQILLCCGSSDEFAKISAQSDVDCREISRNGGKVAFVVMSAGNILDPAAYPVVNLAQDDDPRKLKKSFEQISGKLKSLHKELFAAAGKIHSLELLSEELLNVVNFDQVRDSLEEHGPIVVLSGFVPEPEMEKIASAAKSHGWGFLADDPDEEEDVPVLLKDNRFTRMIKPLFDFLGVVPGYRELDVSGAVLVFFTIFYSIIIGDAGYGVIFLLLAIFGNMAAKKHPVLKLPMRLLMILSVATIVWGALCGSWFSMEFIPGTKKAFPALECFKNFATDTAKQANVQLFCFILAVAQLSTGRIWKALRERNWRSTGEHLGWILIIWGNFFLTVRLIVYPGEFPVFMYYLYGSGLLLVMLCGVRWNQVVDVFQFPFNIIGSFTDVLSYIRLFAVGLAGACIAGSFNNMAFDVCQVSKYLLPAGVLVVLIGHGLNLILAMLSVLVHAVRLNTLEFSNHTGISWSGQSFKPFKKTTNKSEEL